MVNAWADVTAVPTKNRVTKLEVQILDWSLYFALKASVTAEHTEARKWRAVFILKAEVSS